MRFLPPKVLRIADALVDQMFRNHDDRIRQLVRVPILDGVLIEDVDVTTSGTTIHHGLGRVPRGYIVVKSPATVTYYGDEYTDKALDITTSSGTRTISLWVF